ncbi:MAG: restriction endonuclease subunit S [Thermoanaerobaculaceae bacterium]
MRFPAYPSYRASGVKWLGDLPHDWEVKRLKYSASINDEALPETTSPDLEIGYVDISSVDAQAGIVAVEEMAFEDAPSRARRIVRDGDTILSTVRTYLRAIAPIRSPRQNLIVSTGFAVVRPRKVGAGYLSHALRELGFVDTVVARSVGVSYPALNASEVGTIPIPLPPASEQRAIADFLDTQTESIDTLVTKKQELVERLKEKRVALISRTVTRGLPPDAARAAGLDSHPKLRASGVACLGDLPGHWGANAMRRLVAHLDQGWSPNAAAWAADEDEWGVLKLSAVRRGLFLPGENKALADEEVGFPVVTPRAGDLLLSRSNTPDRVGDVCLVPSDHPHLLVPDLLYRIKLNPKVAVAGYVCLFLLSREGRSQIEADARGSSGSMVKVSQDHVLSWRIPCPPIHEQRAIASYLGREAAKIDRLIARVNEAAERLLEYRSALITAAVTGKIDVRAAEDTPTESGGTLQP